MHEFFEHTADLGLRIRAESLNLLFAQAAQALFSAIVSDLDQIPSTQRRDYEIAGTALDYLLFDWLTELLYTFESEGLIFSQFEVRVNDQGLSATCHGEFIDPTRDRLEHEVKAITYHELKVVREADGWLAEVIVDI